MGALVALLVLGCAETPSAADGPEASRMPPFTAIDARLFDHALSPEVFGIIVAGTDDKLDARAKAAEGVLPMRVVTVSRDTEGDEKESYELHLTPVGPPLKGPPPPGDLVLSVDSWSPSYSALRTLESGLVGTYVLLFYKRYNVAGQTTLHWHAEANTEQVRAAVENARLLGEISP